MKAKPKARWKAADYIKGILSGDRVMLSRAITLIESTLPSDRKLAELIIEKILPASGKSIRIGITGVPGVGKSTFIEALGKHLTSQNKKVAVLTVDPSSQKTKGSILGDKTRMDELSKDPFAYVRPSATGHSLGGVTHRTRESILLCEAAGYEAILVETVGVGQSETEVKSMTDFFLLLMLPGAGDELQGIKKGIMEMADAIIITKGDGDNLARARQAQTDYQHSLHLFSMPDSGVITKVLLTSSIEKKGIHETWKLIEDYRTKTKANGYFDNQRRKQNINWFHSQLDFLIKQKIMNRKKTTQTMNALEKKISQSKISPHQAASTLLKKISLTLFLFLFCVCSINAQNLAPQTQRSPRTTDLFNGMPFVRPASNVVGEIHVNSLWGLTSIELFESDQKVEWYFTRHNLQTDELEIKSPLGLKVLSGNRIKSYYVKDTSGVDRKFVNAKDYRIDDVLLTGFLEVLSEGPQPLVKQYYLITESPNYNPALNTGSRDTQIKKKTELYHATDNALNKIPRLKKFLASIGEHAEPVSAFIKTNNLAFNSERDLTLIFNYYNSLLTNP